MKSVASAAAMQVCTSCRRLLRADASRCPDDGAATDTVWTLPKDTRLGAYRIDRMLGEGGMGFVYEATHEVLNRRSAIKIRLLSPPGGPSLRRHPSVTGVAKKRAHTRPPVR